MIFQPLRVFVSSRMEELAAERAAVKEALGELRIDAWLFEKDAGARPGSIEQTFLDEVEAADLYLGLFWNGWGNYTREEYEHAGTHHKDRLVYEKRTELENRDARLQQFLDELGAVESGVTVRRFFTLAELRECVQEDLAAWQARRIRERSPAFTDRSAPVADHQESTQLLRLRDAVEQFWIEGVLEKSIHAEAIVGLDSETRPDALKRPWDEVLELPDQTHRLVSADTPISQIFD